MNIFDSWSKFIIQILQSESSLAASLLKHSVELGSAREALIQGVLNRILPSIYEIGTGEIIDSKRNRSRQIDIVIARCDFPTLLMPSGSKLYLIESVLATIEVKSQLNKESLIKAIENCASVADLVPNVLKGAREQIARERGLKEIEPSHFIHEKTPLETARFNLLGRPVSYIFGFKGYKNSIEEFTAAIQKWGVVREKERGVAMGHIPAVVAAEGCIAWRNAPPYTVEENRLCLIGEDETPLRLLILHILYTLSRKIPAYPDQYGIRPNLDIYFRDIKMPTFVKGLFSAFNKP